MAIAQYLGQLIDWTQQNAVWSIPFGIDELNFSTILMIWWLSLNVYKCKIGLLAPHIFVLFCYCSHIANLISIVWSRKNDVNVYFRHTISNGFGWVHFCVSVFVEEKHKFSISDYHKQWRRIFLKKKALKYIETVNYLHKH